MPVFRRWATEKPTYPYILVVLCAGPVKLYRCPLQSLLRKRQYDNALLFLKETQQRCKIVICFFSFFHLMFLPRREVGRARR